MTVARTEETLSLTEARKRAIQTAADWAAGADFDQFWGEELAAAAFGNSQLSAILAQAQREITQRIRRIGRLP